MAPQSSGRVERSCCRKIIGLADMNTWNRLGQSGTSVPDERLLENSHFSAILESGRPFESFERIDWAAAAPSWISIVGGIIFPFAAVVTLISFSYAALSWVFERWVGHFWTVPFWLFMTMVVPLALVAAFAFAKLLLRISKVDFVITKSKEVL
jgi:hypothetical protein